jgi:hypothetical protein
MEKITQKEIVELAEWLHDRYECSSVIRGWKTQEKCRVDFWDLPKKNRLVMFDIAFLTLQRFREKMADR